MLLIYVLRGVMSEFFVKMLQFCFFLLIFVLLK